jgi:hypothetical protein
MNLTSPLPNAGLRMRLRNSISFHKRLCEP